MKSEEYRTINIFGIDVACITYENFLDIFIKSITEKKKILIAYANAHTLNLIYSDDKIKKLFSEFDLIHPDGIGIFLASKILYRKKGFDKRITGSDFYELLISESVKRNWSYFFFGHDLSTLNKIKQRHSGLNIKGINEGYQYDTEDVIAGINDSKADILIIGLSAPKQEFWIYDNRDRINASVILAVGEGIKVFAGKKIRGPEFARKAGFEWLFRFLANPVRNFNKYIIGNNLFLFRLIKEKLNFKK